MPVDAAALDEMRQMVAETPDINAPDLSALESIAETIAYATAAMRAEGENEADGIELLVRASDLTPDDVRQAERTLRQLGYGEVSTRLRKLAGRRKIGLAPMETADTVPTRQAQ
jgi:hypothetical protein